MSNFAPYIPSQISDIVGLTQALNDRVTGDAAYDAFVQKDAYNAFVSATNTTLAGKQPTIPPGTTAQYYRGDKTWQTLNASAVAGLSTVASSGAYADLSGKPALDDATVSAQDPSSGATVRTLRATLSNLWAAITARADQTLSNLSSAATARFNLGLGNVDNTSDASKQSSFQTAFDGRYGVLSNPTNWNTPFKVSTVGAVGPGTVSINGGGANMTGVGTSFLTTFKKGDTLTVGATTFTINTVTSDTLLAVTTLAAATLTNQPYSYASGERLAVQTNGRTALGGVAAQAAALTLPAAIAGDDALILRDTTSGANARFFFTSPLGSAPDLNISAGRVLIGGRLRLTNGQTEITSDHLFAGGGFTTALQGRVVRLQTDTLNTNVFESGTNIDTSIRGYNNVRNVQLCPTGGNVMVGQATSNALFSVAQPTTGLGTVSNAASGTTITGVGTTFLSTFKPGDSITINGQTVVVSAIASDTLMTTAAITNANSGVAYTLTGGNRMAINGNGNVGIGTTTPVTPLQVNGDISAKNILPLDSTNPYYLGSSTNRYQGIYVKGDALIKSFNAEASPFAIKSAQSYSFATDTNNTVIFSGGRSANTTLRPYSPAYSVAIFGFAGQAMPLLRLDLPSNTSVQQPVGSLFAEMPITTNGSYTGRVSLQATDFAASRTGVTVEADGTQTKISFYGGIPIPKPTLPVPATDEVSTMALANQIRQMMIDLGLAQ